MKSYIVGSEEILIRDIHVVFVTYIGQVRT